MPDMREAIGVLLAGFHIEAVLLYFLDDVFLLHLALKTAQCILKRLTLLYHYFCHGYFTPVLVRFALAVSRLFCGTAPDTSIARGRWPLVVNSPTQVKYSFLQPSFPLLFVY